MTFAAGEGVYPVPLPDPPRRHAPAEVAAADDELVRHGRHSFPPVPTLRVGTRNRAPYHTSSRPGWTSPYSHGGPPCPSPPRPSRGSTAARRPPSPSTIAPPPSAWPAVS